MQAALERHDFDCVQMALNVARARMTFDDKGPHPVPMKDASYEALALPVAVKKKMGIIAMKVFVQTKDHYDYYVHLAPVAPYQGW